MQTLLESFQKQLGKKLADGLLAILLIILWELIGRTEHKTRLVLVCFTGSAAIILLRRLWLRYRANYLSGGMRDVLFVMFRTDRDVSIQELAGHLNLKSKIVDMYVDDLMAKGLVQFENYGNGDVGMIAAKPSTFSLTSMGTKCGVDRGW